MFRNDTLERTLSTSPRNTSSEKTRSRGHVHRPRPSPRARRSRSRCSRWPSAPLARPSRGCCSRWRAAHAGPALAWARPSRGRAAPAGAATSPVTTVTLTPPVPKHKAWMSHSCSWNDMAGTSTPYPRPRRDGQPENTSHESFPESQEHQQTGPSPDPGRGPARPIQVPAEAGRRRLRCPAAGFEVRLPASTGAGYARLRRGLLPGAGAAYARRARGPCPAHARPVARARAMPVARARAMPGAGAGRGWPGATRRLRP